MHMNNKVAKAIRLALVAGVAGTAMSAPTFAADTGAEEVERIAVTGSRIKRTEMEGATPVTVIDSQAIEASGQMSVADVLRSSNMNSFGSFSERSGSSAQSQASVSLRGAGDDRTLVLINGKRMPGSPTLGGSAANINAIPTAAIERIEVLSDGASAVYGSDAVAGVVNIILKKDFEGLELSVGATSPKREGGDETNFSLVSGVSSDKGNLTFSFEHQKRDIIYQRDRWFTKATGHDSALYDDTTGISTYARNFIDGTTGLYSPMSACNNPQMVGGGHVFDYGDGDYVCGFDYTKDAADHAARTYDAGFLSGTYEITPDVQFVSQALFSRNETFGRYAPAAGWFNVDAGQVEIQNWENGQMTGTSINENAGKVRYRFTDVGTRDTKTVDYSTDLQFGLEGEAEMFSWNVNYHYNRAENTAYGSGYVHRPTVENLVASGDFKFGPEGNNDDVIAAISHDTLARDVMTFSSVSGGVAFDAIELPEGEISWYVGGEYFEYDFESTYDKESANGEVIGSSGGPSAGTREVGAVFAESVVPLAENLELNLAVRYDDYSDFGSATTPKVALRYNPIEDLVLRASWGEGFRAPSMSDLYDATSKSSDTAKDYVKCGNSAEERLNCKAKQYDTYRLANEDLGAEESEFLNLGAVYNITENVTTKVEYYNLKLDDKIQFISLQSLIEAELIGPEALAATGGSITRSASGSIEEANAPKVNGKGFETSGIDFDITVSHETGYGEFKHNFAVSWVLEYKEEEFFDGPINDKIGRNGLPEYRANYGLDWTMNDHSVNVIVKHIADQAEDTDKDYNLIGKLSSYTTIDARYTRLLPWNASVSVGVTNLADKDPVLDSSLEYDKSLYNLYGRSYYVNYKHSF